MCDLSSEDRCEFWKVTLRKSKRDRTCACCGLPVFAGEHYQRVLTISDGSASVEVGGLACAFDISVVGEEHRLFPLPSSFHEYLTECAREEEEPRWQAMVDRLEARTSIAHALKLPAIFMKGVLRG